MPRKLIAQSQRGIAAWLTNQGVRLSEGRPDDYVSTIRTIVLYCQCVSFIKFSKSLTIIFRPRIMA